MTREQLYTANIYIRHFRYKRKEVLQHLEEYFAGFEENRQPVMELRNDDHAIYIGVSRNTMPAKNMIFFRKFEKTALYNDAINLFANEGINCVNFLSGSEPMSIRKAGGYSGIGGIYVRSEDEGYIIEPFAHYLQYEYPQEAVD